MIGFYPLGYDDVYQANTSEFTELKNYYSTEKRMDEIRDNQETSSISDVTTNLHNSMNADTGKFFQNIYQLVRI